jgi:hypothetical protein
MRRMIKIKSIVRLFLFFFVLCFLTACKEGGGSAPPPDEPPQEPPPGDPPTDLPPDDGANDPDPVFYPFEFDQETPGGIEIETRGHSIPTHAEIDGWYALMEQCVEGALLSLGVTEFESVIGPPIIIEDDLSNLCGTGSPNGIYCINFAIPFVGIETDHAVIARQSTWKHEFIHHILVMNDISPSHSWNKDHTPFDIWGCQYQL